MKVSNMTSNSGRAVVNQFIVRDNYGNRFFKSYDSIIVKITKSGKVYLDRNNWNYSVTTGKYRDIFLREGIAETRKKIKDGIYHLTNLNK